MKVFPHCGFAVRAGRENSTTKDPPRDVSAPLSLETEFLTCHWRTSSHFSCDDAQGQRRNLQGWVGVFRDLEASVFHRITLGMEKKAWALGT